MRDTERGRDIGRGRSRLPAGGLMQDLIPQIGIMTPAEGRCSTSEPLRCLMFVSLYVVPCLSLLVSLGLRLHVYLPIYILTACFFKVFFF